MRLAKPIWQDSVFGDSVQNTIRTDDGGVHGARKNQEPNYHHKCAKREAQQLRAPQVHCQAGDQIVFVNRHAHGIGDDHYE